MEENKKQPEQPEKETKEEPQVIVPIICLKCGLSKSSVVGWLWFEALLIKCDLCGNLGMIRSLTIPKIEPIKSEKIRASYLEWRLNDKHKN